MSHSVSGESGGEREQPPPAGAGLRPAGVAPYPLGRLRELLPLGAVPDDADLEVTGITHNSRQVVAGDLFAALPGAATHGARFVEAALDAGAAAIFTDEDGASVAGEAASRAGVPVVVVDHPRAWLGEIAAAVYGHPAKDLMMLGVTGTNGKTTTSYLIEAGLRQAGLVVGLMGTVQTRIGATVMPSVRTTPEATDVHATLAVMREHGASACVMEVSSHALAFGRVDGIRFDVAGFTNLSQDHLDFHAGMEDYFAVKTRLFTSRRSARAVVCVDDEYGRRLAAQIDLPGATVAAAGWQRGATTTAPAHDEPARDPRVRWRVEPGEPVRLAGTDGRVVDLQVPLPGDFNVANTALAVAMLVEAGIDAEVAAAGVGGCPGVPGRMERVHVDDPEAPMMVVDYAHTPDAIENVLLALRTPRPGHQPGMLVAVTGAGGDRDRDKRPLMGAAAARHADVLVITDDNPRQESPEAIRAAVRAGAGRLDTGGDVVEVADRRGAIRAALDRVRGPDDIVVVLGKGHEPGQEIAGTVYPFDDRVVLREEYLGKMGKR
ncbi:UDP-N-acetylmuramoyl-L-alanyl-D-glutamate--2,6-diaminopimelate ligase [Phytoactinopolyspora limicola]|uniref:UDP-N-acetylmuramoyl-L-alanyl-D-glutamate--2, 6-diaminopimelate ligase n=1 Tax=Phytoactinopolyspora limicola TaxID=2715536 RepID=UPI001A9C4790|nr:UDP-N-acetylmuramoyl-L-alanyl-D-glutamate--2,6-diaminopimelate ligase [Phytoactinopolyspora limicola]